MMKDNTKEKNLKVVKAVNDLINKGMNMYQACEQLHIKPFKYTNARYALRKAGITDNDVIISIPEVKAISVRSITINITEETWVILEKRAKCTLTTKEIIAQIYLNSIRLDSSV